MSETPPPPHESPESPESDAAEPSVSVPPAAEYDSEPPAANGKRSARVIGLAVLALVAVGGLAAFLLTRGDDSSATNEAKVPEEVVTGYITAFAGGDCEGMAVYISEKSLADRGVTRDEAVEQCNDSTLASGVDVNVDEVTTTAETADSATVLVTTTIDGETEDTEVDVVKEDGLWVIDTVAGESESGE